MQVRKGKPSNYLIMKCGKVILLSISLIWTASKLFAQCSSIPLADLVDFTLTEKGWHPSTNSLEFVDLQDFNFFDSDFTQGQFKVRVHRSQKELLKTLKKEKELGLLEIQICELKEGKLYLNVTVGLIRKNCYTKNTQIVAEDLFAPVVAVFDMQNGKWLFSKPGLE